MDHALRCLGRPAQAVEIVEGAAVHLRPRGDERGRRGIRTSQPDHLVTCADELGNNGRTDPAGRAGDEDTHEDLRLSTKP